MNIEKDFRNIKEGIKDYKLYKLIQSYAIHKWFKNLLYIKEAETMAIILITALLVVIMLGLSFLSYLSENNLLDDIEN